MRWHPPRAVLEVVELVLDGSLPALAPVLARLGAGDLAELGRRAGGGEPWPDGVPPDGGVPGVLVEDAEGTPVARLVAGDLRPERPFTHPPLRAHRRAPGEPWVDGGGPALVAALAGVPSRADVDAAIDEAAGAGLGLVWLVVTGAGRGPLPPEVAWRAAAALVDRAAARGVVAHRAAVAVPLLPGPVEGGSDGAAGGTADGTADGGGDPLLAAVVDGRPGAPGGRGRVLPDAAEPGYARELGRACGGGAPGGRRGVAVLLTGLSGSGKSTIAKALAARLVETGERPVTLLDGDEVRRMLSAGLGFSRADRDLNVRRIGFVAAEVARHGGLALCAPIAPFAQVRAQVRADVEAAGGELVLVHVATPVTECERRDRKGLYARARRGEVAEFTGISSPYEEPADADLRLDTTGRDVTACVDEVWALLAARGHVAELDPKRTLESALGC